MRQPPKRDLRFSAVIAGGRDFQLLLPHFQWLDHLKDSAFDITEVVSGCAPGADAGGEEWAKLRNIPVKRFPAEWDRHGRAAGPLRNEAMAKYLASKTPKGIVILFPGGKGTANMASCALMHKLHVITYKE